MALAGRVADLEGATRRIEEKVDANTAAVDTLTIKIDEADWNGKGPIIRSLAEVAPYLIELASVHRQDIELAKAERLIAERKIQRRKKFLAKFHLTTGHRALVAFLTAVGVIGTALWGLTYALQAWQAIHQK